jgi:hypothetical protein
MLPCLRLEFLRPSIIKCIYTIITHRNLNGDFKKLFGYSTYKFWCVSISDSLGVGRT